MFNTETFFDRKWKNNFLVVSRIRQKLLESGTNTIATLPKVYRCSTSFDGKNKVNYDDFFLGLANYGINLRKEEMNVIFYVLTFSISWL